MYQKVIFAGYLTDKPVMRYTPQGKAVTNFTLAINDYGEKTMWMRVTVWGDRAESVAEYLDKGSPVLVEGRLDYDEGGNPETYTGKDGKTRSSFKMTAYEVKFLPSKDDKKPQKSVEIPW